MHPSSMLHARPVIRRSLVFALMVLLACLSSTASAGVENPKDTAAVNAVQLDMALLQKLAAITRELKNVPEVVRDDMEDAREMQKDDHGVLRTPPIDTFLVSLNRHPEFKAAVAKQGLSGRQYWLAMFAVVNGSFAAAFTKPGEDPSAAEFAKWQVNPAHYQFARQHAKEIKRLLPND